MHLKLRSSSLVLNICLTKLILVLLHLVALKSLSLTKYEISASLLTHYCLLSSTQDNCHLYVSISYVSYGVFVTVSLMLLLRFLSMPLYPQDLITVIVYFYLVPNLSLTDCIWYKMLLAVRLILRAKRYDSVTPMLQQLRWLKIPELIEFEFCLTT